MNKVHKGHAAAVAAVAFGALAAMMPSAAAAGDAQAATIAPAHPLLDNRSGARLVYRIAFCGAAAEVIGGADGAQSCGAVSVGLDRALEAHKTYEAIGTNLSKTSADIVVLSPGNNEAYIPFCMRKVDSDRPATGAISPETGDLHFFDTGYRGDCAGYFNTESLPWDIADGKAPPTKAWNPDLTDPYGKPKQVTYNMR